MENSPGYSVEITDLIGTTPKWILRTGSGLLLGLLLLAVGLASVVSIPEQNKSVVLLKAATPPYYLVQTAEPLQLLVLSGQRVAQGQWLAQGPSPVKSGVRAPFSGTLYYENATNGIRRYPGDTLALVVPLATAYQFQGQLPVSWVHTLKTQSRLAIQVPLYNQQEGALTLWGHLRYVKPVIQHGELRYVGELDSTSNAALHRHFAAITQLEGMLSLSSGRKSLLHRLLN